MFWEYLTPGEQALAFNLAKSTFKEQSLEQLEERMAESFETFVATKIPSIFEVLWNKLLRLLGFTINNFGSLNQFFNSIEGGVFSKQQSFQTGIERSANVIGYFSSLQQYQLFKKLLLDTFSILEKERKETGAPAKSYTELVLDSFDRLDLIRNNIDQALDENTPTERNIIKAALDVVLAPAAYKVKKAFVDKFFGQAQTKETMLKLIGEKQLQLINEATARQENLLIKQSTGEDVEQDLLDNDEVLSALKAERFDTELEDPTNKITGAVKQRLISLKYKKGDKEGYVALGEAFSILIDRIASVPITSLDDTLKALSINFQDISPTQSTLGNIRQEVGRFMNSTIANVKNGLNDTKLRKDVTFRKDAQSEHLYVIYSKDGSSVQNITQFEALNPKNKDKYGMLSQHENAPLDSLLKDLVKVIPTKGSVDVYKDMAKAYYFFEDLDFIRSLIAALGSLRSFQSQKGIKSYSYGNFSTRYLRNKTGGGNQIHEAHFNLKFSEYVQNQGAKVFSDGIPKLFSNDFLIEARTAKTVAERTEVAKKLLNLFKLGRTVDKISAPALEALFARINRGALDEMQRIFALKPDKYESLEDYKKARTGDALISGESGIRDAVIDILNTHYQLVETHSFMRGDGKRAYGWIDASFQSSFLQSFVNAIGNKVHRKFANFFVSEGRLKTNDRFLKDNILFSKSSHRATIHGYIDHDSIQ